MRNLCLFALLLAAPALAGDALAEESPAAEEAPPITEKVATYRQLAWELHALAKRDAWTGVERIYVQMVDLDLPMEAEEHILGATAAQGIGDVAATLARLRAAHALKEDRAVIEWMYRLDTGFGEVSIVDERRKKPKLEAAKPFFMPDANKAVQFAAGKSAEGRFDGLLPVGEYKYGKETFTVEPGERVELAYEK
ncbi:MAG: hypothetical protein EP330_25840 [Deltaproteobacteria bacterium]|nr:MAG: hypothetical protein EP330_25840 [Deltaproteobacteria bacterium]